MALEATEKATTVRAGAARAYREVGRRPAFWCITARRGHTRRGSLAGAWGLAKMQ